METESLNHYFKPRINNKPVNVTRRADVVERMTRDVEERKLKAKQAEQRVYGGLCYSL